MTNHVPRQCTLMFLYSALNYSYLVLQVHASVLYIVQFPTSSTNYVHYKMIVGMNSMHGKTVINSQSSVSNKENDV